MRKSKMLNSDDFKTSFKIFSTVFVNGKKDVVEKMATYYQIMKEDFSDKEFKEICLELSKTATFFPAPAEFYKLKKKAKVPDVGELLGAWNAGLIKHQ